MQKILATKRKKIRIDTIRDTFLGSYQIAGNRTWYFAHTTKEKKRVFYALDYQAEENLDKNIIISEGKTKRLLLENYGIEGSDYDMENILKIWPDFLMEIRNRNKK